MVQFSAACETTVGLRVTSKGKCCKGLAMLACIANELLCICLRSGDGSSLWQGILIRGSELRRKSALGIRKNLIARRRRSPQTFSLFDVRGYLGALTKDAKSILAMCRTDEARHRAEDAGNEPLRSGTTRHGALQRVSSAGGEAVRWSEWLCRA